MNSASSPLWTLSDLVAAAGARLDGEGGGDIVGVSIDTRTIGRSDLFVALRDQRDGHEFVPQAFEKGAGAALVSESYERKSGDGALLRVEDPLQALEKIAIAARVRLTETAIVVAVTGSAGKTTTKEMLRAVFARFGKVHASEKSYNNHWGVPLTLARMPVDTEFAVIEMGMNHAGEIRPLTRMTRPHIALVTSVLPVHLAHFSGVDEIARAKAEIFEGLDLDGFAILPRDSTHFQLLAKLAAEALGNEKALEDGAIVTFGEHEKADIRLLADDLELTANGCRGAFFAAHKMPFELSLAGRHNAINAMGCISVWIAASALLFLPESGDERFSGHEGVMAAFASMKIEPAGRGQVFELADDLTLIDESYNANPASMRAALENLSLYPRERRRIAVLGDMLELGGQADALHKELKTPLLDARVDLVLAAGPHMKSLYDSLPADMQGGYGQSAGDLVEGLQKVLQGRDVVMIKGSLGSAMGQLVKVLRDKSEAALAGEGTHT